MKKGKGGEGKGREGKETREGKERKGEGEGEWKGVRMEREDLSEN